jgi:glycosyltransferase involved in cell wall biosynthesis
MNIGIDAKWFFKGNPSGRVVVQNLVASLLSADHINRYFIFLRNEDKGLEFPYVYPNLQIVYIWGRNNMISNVLVSPYYARKYGIDVFLYQYFSPFLKFSKTIVLIHDVIFETNAEFFTTRERLYFKPMRFLSRFANRVVTVSENEKNRLIQYRYGKVQRVVAVHLGVNEIYTEITSQKASSLAFIKEKLGLPENFALYVGRLNLRKNIDNLIRAFQYVKDKNLKLVLAGSYDWKMFDVKKFIKEYGLEERVQLIGFVESEDLPALYSASKVFCFISHEEGFGLPPLEAMACGIPVVVANRGSLPEICADAGFYVEPKDPEMVSQAINKLLHDTALWEEMSHRCKNQAAKFSWNETARKYIALFDQVQNEMN